MPENRPTNPRLPFQPDTVLCWRDVFRAWPSIGRSISKWVIQASKATLIGGTRRLHRGKPCRRTSKLPDRKSLRSQENSTQVPTTNTARSSRPCESPKALTLQRVHLQTRQTALTECQGLGPCRSTALYLHPSKTSIQMPRLSSLSTATCRLARISSASMKMTRYC